jgi:hypothetical protein
MEVESNQERSTRELPLLQVFPSRLNFVSVVENLDTTHHHARRPLMDLWILLLRVFRRNLAGRTGVGHVGAWGTILLHVTLTLLVRILSSMVQTSLLGKLGMLQRDA